MSHQPPSPASSPAPRPGRLAPDLGPWERGLAERLAALPRAGLPEGLGTRCLSLVEERSGSSLERAADPQTSHGLPWSVSARRWRVLWAAAASLLLALGVASLAGSRGATNAEGRARPDASFARLQVVDDPSVPLFHGLETFDQLGGSVIAAAPASGSRSGR